MAHAGGPTTHEGRTVRLDWCAPWARAKARPMFARGINNRWAAFYRVQIVASTLLAAPWCLMNEVTMARSSTSVCEENRDYVKSMLYSCAGLE